MTITSIKNIYFSPTGKTKETADCLASQFPFACDCIDLSIFGKDYSAYCFDKETLCIVSVPSFGGRVPGPAIQALSQMKGNETPAVIVAAFGNRAYEDTLLELKNTLETVGFVCVAAIAASTEHSIIRKFGAGRPDTKDKEELAGYAAKLLDYLNRTKAPSSVTVPGNDPYKDVHTLPLTPVASSSCSECGVCAKACPTGAILFSHPKETDGSRCISCMRCINVCPSHSRLCDPRMLAATEQKIGTVCKTRKANECYIAS